LLQQINQYQ